MCTTATRGVLGRRHITPVLLARIGKEANLSEETEHGEVTAWDQKVVSYPAPGDDWESEVLAVLGRIKAETIHDATGVSLRTIYRVRGTGKPPSRNARGALERFARAYEASTGDRAAPD